MSKETWLAEFYPVPVSNEMQSWNREQLIKHSIQKWEGLSRENLAKHGLENPPINIDASTCALCKVFHNDDADADSRECAMCPLYQVRDDHRCDEQWLKNGEQWLKNGEYQYRDTPFGAWDYTNFFPSRSNKPMLRALNDALNNELE
jgi:hypothetical protein